MSCSSVYSYKHATHTNPKVRGVYGRSERARVKQGQKGRNTEFLGERTPTPQSPKANRTLLRVYGGRGPGRKEGRKEVGEATHEGFTMLHAGHVAPRHVWSVRRRAGIGTSAEARVYKSQARLKLWRGESEEIKKRRPRVVAWGSSRF